MLLKKKTILAITVKLLLCVTITQAQTACDSVKRNTVKSIPFFSNIILIKPPVYQNQVTGNFYSTQLPFFCNKELQLQKATGFPVKFRLGSVEDCDKLEGKNR